MDVREKLVELLENHCAVIGEDHCKASQSGECATRDCAICLASDLISNGVTVQEWIPVTERLPEADVAVLARCFYHESWRTLVCYKSKRNAGEWYTNVAGQWVQVTHWMPLPEPPKGE